MAAQATGLEVAGPETSGEAVRRGFVASHAPQIFRRPPEEDPAELDRFYAALQDVAKRIEGDGTDALVFVGDDHLHNMFLNLLPVFTIGTGTEVRAAFAGTEISCEANPDLANDLLDHLLDDGFDPALSQDLTLDHAFMIPLYIMQQVGFSVPVIPIVANVYVPPQPSMKRCYALGNSIAKWATGAGLTVSVMGSGGMSHYPGTERAHSPDVESDHMILEWIRNGDIRSLIELTNEELDRMGQGELLAWAVAFGARGDDVALKSDYYWDSGHCGYVVLEF